MIKFGKYILTKTSNMGAQAALCTCSV